eukprot:TRINITY_DN802_c0_g1_i16.p1 TRINITY_DN802_c0_g1~~TRINITY_DN802_c0_g1_i16.p1  ORF type:complete len:112 (+),score=10.42 TRINITY_DN802_c0_g1_i16:259-594(+)
MYLCLELALFSTDRLDSLSLSLFSLSLCFTLQNSKKSVSTAQGTLAHTETVAPATVLATATASAPVLATQFLRYGHFMVQAGLRERGLFWIRRVWLLYSPCNISRLFPGFL